MTQWGSPSWATSTVSLLLSPVVCVYFRRLSYSLESILPVLSMLFLISEDTPSMESISAVKQLLQSGVSLGFLNPQFVLLGHRDLSVTECPGNNLYDALPKLRSTTCMSFTNAREDWQVFRSHYLNKQKHTDRLVLRCKKTKMTRLVFHLF